ncbi:MAG: UDP-N-acetylmuramate--L-alanine ligase [Clostridia bacterium]|nr:UDP-N-acetylmuramate--L-alanine ligase [Clostridia bacterium]
MNNILSGKNNIHFIGVGGISMSALAEIFLSNGYSVSGSDINYSFTISQLEAKGLKFFNGHFPENVHSAQAVVYTSAVSADNPEIKEANRLGIDIISRAQLLGYIMDEYKKSIAIAGTHGKTTVTSMVSYIFEKLSQDPTILVGAYLDIIKNNMKIGSGDYFIAEACEYCRSFLNFRPYCATILNVEPDHLDYYKDADDYHSAYSEFLGNVHTDGFVVACQDDVELMKIVSAVPQKVVTYGLSGGDFTASEIHVSDGRTKYVLLYKEEKLCDVTLSVHGSHNVSNSLAALANAYMFGLDMQKAADALTDFKGASRRFELRGNVCGAKIYDDYAHHPTEIKATLDTAKQITDGKIICIFQPHTYSRTKMFFDEFASAFEKADVVILADIYAAREKNDGTISSKMLADKMSETFSECYYIGNFEDIASMVKSVASANDTILVMGAGDIVKLTDILLQ